MNRGQSSINQASRPSLKKVRAQAKVKKVYHPGRVIPKSLAIVHPPIGKTNQKVANEERKCAANRKVGVLYN